MRTQTIIAAIAITLSPPLAASALAAPPLVAPAVSPWITVVTEGSGPDVILIPGLASSRDVWKGLAARLKATHRLHLIQIAGFAGTPPVADPAARVAAPAAEAIADYISDRGIKAPVIIGHSLGGEVALMLGARHPDRVGRIVVVDALPFYTLLLDPAATVATATPRATAFRDSMLAASPEESSAMQTVALARLAKTAAARPALVKDGVMSDRKTVANATYELMTTDLRPELKQIVAPVEIIYAYDPLYGVTPEKIDGVFRTAYATTPAVRFQRIDDSFHFIMIDQATAFEKTVVDFIDR